MVMEPSYKLYRKNNARVTTPTPTPFRVWHLTMFLYIRVIHINQRPWM